MNRTGLCDRLFICKHYVLQYLSSVLGMIKSGNHKSSNLSSLIGATVNRVVVSMKDEIQRTTGIFLEGMNMLQATILLQNETITTLQHEIQRVSTSVWRLRAEVTAEKLANKHGKLFSVDGSYGNLLLDVCMPYNDTEFI